MRASVLLSLVLGALAPALAACGSDRGDSGPAVTPGAPAGDVREVTGAVTARRGDEPARPLRVGDVVAGDDVVTTGADGAVVIELRHNGVRWSLGAAQQKQVAASAAWAAPRRDGPATAGDRSTAAGRHAEREAADTAASATAEVAPAAPPPVPAAAAPEPPAPDPEAPGDGAGDDPPDTGAREQQDPSELLKVLGEAGGEGDGAIGGVSGVGGGHSGINRGGSIGGEQTQDQARVQIGAVTVDGPLDPALAKKMMKRHQGRWRHCWQNVVEANPDARGRVDLAFDVDEQGAVVRVRSAATGAAGDARPCLEANVRRLVFPAQDGPSSVEATLVLGVQ